MKRRALKVQRERDMHSSMTWRQRRGAYVGAAGAGYQHRAEEPVVILKFFLTNENMSAQIQHASDVLVC